MKGLLVGLLAISTVGCADDYYPRTLYVSQEYTPEQVGVILVAVEGWREASGLPLAVVVGEGSDWSISPRDLEEGSAGTTLPRAGTIHTDPALTGTPHALLGTVTHELGHALGIYGHSSSGLMYESRDGSARVCIDDLALEKLCEERDCDRKQPVCLEEP